MTPPPNGVSRRSLRQIILIWTLKASSPQLANCALEVALATVLYAAVVVARWNAADGEGVGSLLLGLATAAYCVKVVISIRKAILELSASRKASSFTETNQAILNYELASCLDPMITSLVRSDSWNQIVRLLDPDLGMGQWDYLHCFESSYSYEATSIEQINRVRMTVLSALLNLKELGNLDDDYKDLEEFTSTPGQSGRQPFRKLLFPMFTLEARVECRRLLRETLGWGADFLSPEQRIAASRVLGSPLMRTIDFKSFQRTEKPHSGMIETTYSTVDAAWHALLADMTAISIAASKGRIFIQDHAYAAGNLD